ncbi:MAG: ABC transporter substrate-binding protein [Gemmatimonadota bacterium]|nr:ABC transporter substrate-binding protein [Gemmatimonadota bacterium]
MRASRAAAAALLLLPLACGGADDRPVITLPGSAVGAEAELLRRQIDRFTKEHPGIRVELQRTPDDATQRHQLYVQRLNARSDDPDILQLDVIWTPEFAAAGWLLPLDRFDADTTAFFRPTVEANVWDDTLYAIPWFVDVGMLYWRTDLLDAPPETMEALVEAARRGKRPAEAVTRGIVWQGARYEGLVTVFLEYLGGFGGEILADDGTVVVDSPEAVEALSFMRDQIHRWDVAPEQVLTWHEEETRFAFQNGTAVMMRNWPYAYALMSGEDSRVAGRFAVAPMPAAPGGEPTVALGGSQLAISAHSDAPEHAWALLEFLTAPEQMLERAVVAGQFPTRPALFDDPALDEVLAIPAERAREIIERATARPVTPIYTQLSEILQIQLHRALVGQAEPADALETAAEGMRRAIEETGVRDLRRREGAR